MTGPKTVGSLQPGDIVYISCELSDYSDNNIDAAKTINLAVNNKPNDIVLYSEYAASCLFIPSEDFQYFSMYSMQNASSSAAIVGGLLKNNPPYPDTSISVNQSSSAFATKDQSSSSGITKTKAPDGPDRQSGGSNRSKLKLYRRSIVGLRVKPVHRLIDRSN